MRSFWERGRIFLDILGALATLFALYQAATFIFFDKRAISAAYRVQTLAQSGVAFDAAAILKPDLSQSKKVVEADLIVWNSGTQEIDEKDVRREVTISIDKTSNLLAVKQGLEHSNKTNDFHFDRIAGESSYKLAWDVFDPGDFFEVNFLVGTNLEPQALQKIVQVEGLFAGNVRVSMRRLEEIQSFRSITTVILGVVIFFALSFLVTVLLSRDGGLQRRFNAMPAWPGAPIFVGGMVLVGSASFALSYPIAAYFFYVPIWLEPLFTLPFVRH